MKFGACEVVFQSFIGAVVWSTFLRNNNYKGTADEEVVERWLNDVCRSVAAELSEEDSSFVSPAPVNRKRQQKKKRSEYS